MDVAVVGCGYVGLVTALGLASTGHRVVGIEVDKTRRDRIEAGQLPFHEPGMQELLSETLTDGCFTVSGQVDAVADAEVVFLAVQTPPGPTGAIDLRFLEEAAGDVAAAFAAAPRPRVVAVRSTVVPGTTDSVIAPLFADSETAVASNPEFLREGTAMADFVRPDRIVIGCDDARGQRLLTRLYGPLDAPVITTTPATAETAKYTSNALLATLISFSNEIARTCETLSGVDVEDVLGIVHLDRRLRPRVNGHTARPEILSYLRAGCGYGGSCLPKDLSALIAHRHDAGDRAPLLEAARAINDEQPGRVVTRTAQALGGLQGRAVTVLGVAFKGGTDDLRHSPGLTIVEELLEQGSAVTVYDPLVGGDALGPQVARGVHVAASLHEAVSGADACVLASNAPEFEGLQALVAGNGTPGPLVVDGRRALAPGGFPVERYLGVGRGAAPAPPSATAAARSSGVPMSR